MSGGYDKMLVVMLLPKNRYCANRLRFVSLHRNNKLTVLNRDTERMQCGYRDKKQSSAARDNMCHLRFITHLASIVYNQ